MALSNFGVIDRKSTTAVAAVNVIDADGGWKTVHVFCGTSDTVPPTARNMTGRTRMSQVKQDETVFNLLGQKKGSCFVELTTNDPMWSWNSCSLEMHHDLTNPANCCSSSLASQNPCWIHWLCLPDHSHLRDGQSDTACDGTPAALVVAPEPVADAGGSESASKTSSIPGLAWTQSVPCSI
jgi:hypothetical protein